MSILTHNSTSTVGTPRQTRLNGMIMESETVDFLDAVMDPFKATQAARVPDLHKVNTLCMKDFIDAKVVTMPALTTLIDIHYCLIFWSWGNNNLYTSLNEANPTENPEDSWYRMHALFIGADGVAHTDASGTYMGINNDQILGMQSDGTCDYSGYASALRVFAGGLKVLPTIETITSSDTTAVLNYWGGLMTPGDLNNILDGPVVLNAVDEVKSQSTYSSSQHFNFTPVSNQPTLPMLPPKMKPLTRSNRHDRLNRLQRRLLRNIGALNPGTDVASFARNCKEVQEYPNCEGVTVRYDPFQFEEQLEMYNVERIQNSSSAKSSNRTDHIPFPFVLCEFTLPITSSLIDPVAMPIKVFASFWLETELIEPTPIFSTLSPVDLNFDKVRAIAGNVIEYPVVTQGHSFKSFRQQAAKFVRHVKVVAREMAPYMKEFGVNRAVNAATGGVSGRISKVARRQNKKKKKNKAGLPKRAPRQRKYRKAKGTGNGQLPGRYVTRNTVGPVPN
jgi:hypothetical protein